MTKQKSAAFMADRKASSQSLDFYRTPAWVTRALLDWLDTTEICVPDDANYCLDPCAGDGAMARVLQERFDFVQTCDIKEYGYPLDWRMDFLTADTLPNFDWVIMNPPFNRAEAFINRAFDIAVEGVAVLGRIQLLESIGRYENLWAENPCDFVLAFSERVACEDAEGNAAPSAMMYAWFIWLAGFNAFHDAEDAPLIDWIPPGSKALFDY